MLCKTPKTLNAVNVILAAVGKRLTVVQPMMFAEAVQRIVTVKGVDVVHRALSRMLSNVRHQFFSRYLLHDFGIYPAVALQKAQYNAFSSCPSSAAYPCACRRSTPRQFQSHPSVCFLPAPPHGRRPRAVVGTLCSPPDSPRPYRLLRDTPVAVDRSP